MYQTITKMFSPLVSIARAHGERGLTAQARHNGTPITGGRESRPPVGSLTLPSGIPAASGRDGEMRHSASVARTEGDSRRWHNQCRRIVRAVVIENQDCGQRYAPLDDS